MESPASSRTILNGVRRVATGSEALDALLDGGFPEGSVILLAGNPGVGKTVFSTSFLVEGARQGEVGVYLTFAEDRQTLVTNLSSHLEVDLARLEEEGLLKILEGLTLDERGVNITLETLLETIQVSGARRLVIDSVTAMLQSFPNPIRVRQFIHTVISKIVRQMGCTTLLNVEIPLGEERVGIGVEQFVADGVLVLRAGELDGRLIREMEVVKMRGVRLRERKVIYSLDRGFRVFQPLKLKEPKKYERFRAIPGQAGRVSSGIPQIDELIGGGYPPGETILLEVIGPVTTYQYNLFVSPLAWNILVQGHPVIVIPSVGVDIEVIRRYLREGGIGEDEARRLIRVMQAERPSEEVEDPLVVPVNSGHILKSLSEFGVRISEIIRQLGPPSLMITGVDTLYTYFGGENLERALNIGVSKARHYRALNLLILKPGIPQPSIYDLCRTVSGIHFRVTREHGVLLFYGVKPRTGHFAVELDLSQGYRLPKLTPIV
jgi:KaiC/GvpD/RAD55 family RecA-like ATPase